MKIARGKSKGDYCECGQALNHQKQNCSLSKAEYCFCAIPSAGAALHRGRHSCFHSTAVCSHSLHSFIHSFMRCLLSRCPGAQLFSHVFSLLLKFKPLLHSPAMSPRCGEGWAPLSKCICKMARVAALQFHCSSALFAGVMCLTWSTLPWSPELADRWKVDVPPGVVPFSWLW